MSKSAVAIAVEIPREAQKAATSKERRVGVGRWLAFGALVALGLLCLWLLVVAAGLTWPEVRALAIAVVIFSAVAFLVAQ